MLYKPEGSKKFQIRELSPRQPEYPPPSSYSWANFQPPHSLDKLPCRLGDQLKCKRAGTQYAEME